MTDEEIIGLAGKAGIFGGVAEMEGAAISTRLIRFAELVAVEYKRDALRYRMLRSNERFVVDEKCADGNWEPIHYDDLDHAIDAAIGETK